MRLFAGLGHTDYQDVLRALGYLCDTRGWQNLRVIEHEDGLMVQCTEGNDSGNTSVYLFTDEDLQLLLREAYARRRKRMLAPFDLSAHRIGEDHLQEEREVRRIKAGPSRDSSLQPEAR